MFISIQSGCSVLAILGQYENSFALLTAIGFKWGDEGIKFFEAAFDIFKAGIPVVDYKCESIFFRLLIFLSSPECDIHEAEVNAWIPSPTELAQFERGYLFMRRLYSCRYIHLFSGFHNRLRPHIDNSVTRYLIACFDYEQTT